MQSTRRAVRTLASLADVAANARWTPFGILAAGAKGLDAWWRNAPDANDYIEGWVRPAASPCWPLAIDKARGTARRLKSETYAAAMEATIQGHTVRWVDRSWGSVVGPFVRSDAARIDLPAYLWPTGDHAALETSPNVRVVEELYDVATHSALSDEVATILKKYLNKGKTRGAVFWGPPGSGKSVAARAVASALGGRSLSLRAQDLESSLAVVRALAPMVVIMHDIHAKSPDRSAIERLRQVVPIVLATSVGEPDQEITRPGRFERTFEVPQAGLPIAYQAEYDLRCEVEGGTEADRAAWLDELTRRAAPKKEGK